MSISSVIDERYRLRPTDLGRGSLQVTIQNVSWQGVEQLQPLLHLREFPQKRLLLSQRQVQSLIAIIGSALDRDWVGHTILIAAEYDDGERLITLHPLTAASGEQHQRRPRVERQERMRTLLLLLLLALLFSLVFLLEQADGLWSNF